MPTDTELKIVIDAFLRGDRSLHNSWRIQISGFVARHYSGSTVEQDDITAEILQTLLIGLKHEKFRGGTLKQLAGYIYGIARLKIMRAIRDRGSWPTVDPDTLGQSGSTARGPEYVIDRELIAKILDTVDPKCRSLLELKFVRGWSDQEIADHLHKSKNAVSTAISRCVKKIQQLDFVREIMYQESGCRHSSCEEGGQ